MITCPCGKTSEGSGANVGEMHRSTGFYSYFAEDTGICWLCPACALKAATLALELLQLIKNDYTHFRSLVIVGEKLIEAGVPVELSADEIWERVGIAVEDMARLYLQGQGNIISPPNRRLVPLDDARQLMAVLTVEMREGSLVGSAQLLRPVSTTSWTLS